MISNLDVYLVIASGLAILSLIVGFVVLYTASSILVFEAIGNRLEIRYSRQAKVGSILYSVTLMCILSPLVFWVTPKLVSKSVTWSFMGYIGFSVFAVYVAYAYYLMFKSIFARFQSRYVRVMDSGDIQWKVGNRLYNTGSHVSFSKRPTLDRFGTKSYSISIDEHQVDGSLRNSYTFFQSLSEKTCDGLVDRLTCFLEQSDTSHLNTSLQKT